MPLNLDAVGSSSEPAERTWSSGDCLLYALGVGAGASDPIGFELEFTTENSADVRQAVLPTFVTVAGASAAPRTAIGEFDPAMLVHAEQSIELHGSIPTDATVTTTSTLTAIYDKGSGAAGSIRVDIGRCGHRSSGLLRGDGLVHPRRGRVRRRARTVGCHRTHSGAGA